MTKKAPAPNLRREVIRAARDADVDVTVYDRAIILGQIAALLAEHPKIGPIIAFKGGAIAKLVDGSPRFSKDLDSHVAHARTRIRANWVRAALTKGELARRIVKRVDDIQVTDREGLKVPLIVCHPRSGAAEVYIEFEVKWDEPLLMRPVPEPVEVPDGKTTRVVRLPVMALVERVAEKVSTFLNRGLDRDAFDLHFHAQKRGPKALTKDDWKLLASLVSDKIELDSAFKVDEDLPSRFERQFEKSATNWGRKGDIVIEGDLPGWDVVGPNVQRFAIHVPTTKTGRVVVPREYPGLDQDGS